MFFHVCWVWFEVRVGVSAVVDLEFLLVVVWFFWLGSLGFVLLSIF